MHDSTIKLAEPGATLYDDQVTGLHVRVSKRGAKSFYLYYRTKDRTPRRPKLGDYGILSLAKAREIARDLLVKVAEGKDPTRERLTKSETMTELFEKAFADHWSKRVPEYQKEVRRLWTKDIQPKIGKLKVKDVTYQDCLKVHESVTSKTNHTLAIVSKMLSLAERYELRPVNSNPCTAIERRPRGKRKRFASPTEIASIGPLLEKYAAQYPEHVAFLYLMMFTGARPTEIGRASRAQVSPVVINGETYGKLVWEMGKNKETREVYLPPQAMKVIDSLPKNRDRLVGVKTPRKLWRIIREEAGCPDLWARDWRRTFATVGLGSGQNLDMIGELLGHKDPKTTKVYAKLMEDKAFLAVKNNAAIVEKMLKGS